MNIRVNVQEIPEWCSSDPITGICVSVRKMVYCDDLTPVEGYVTCAISGGAQEDVEILRRKGFVVEEVK
jgi:hypothetical protein